MASQIRREDEIGVGWKLTVFVGLAAIALVWTPFWGSGHVPFSALWGRADDTAAVTVLWELRIPRVAMAFLAGAALATAGMVFQAVFHDRLATPFSLGTSSGAALGALLATMSGWTFRWQGVSVASLSAVVGAAIVLALVCVVNRRSSPTRSPTMLLMTGVGMCFFLSVVILLVQFRRDATSTVDLSLLTVRGLELDGQTRIPPSACDARPYEMLRWTLGGFDAMEDVVGSRDLWRAMPFIASGCLIVWYLLHELNLLAAGEEFAFSRGVKIERIRLALLFGAVVMIGGAVAVCGPIVLVGLTVPHCCRHVVGADHRRLYPATWLFGGTVLTVADAGTRVLTAPVEIPVGAVLALVGAPLFLWLLAARSREPMAS